MEPAMVACGGVAAACLGLWLVVQAGTVIGSVPDHLADGFVGEPSRALATAVLAIVGFLAVPQNPVAAEPIPPIVRLAEEHTEPMEPVHDAPVYEVQRGDSLWCIAAATLVERRGSRPNTAAIAQFWPNIYTANQTVIGDDPDLIHPGQRLTIPEP